MKKKHIMITLGAVAAGCLAAKHITKGQLDDLLATLAEKVNPKNLLPTAMCYSTPRQPERIEYVCPACGAKTIFMEGDVWDVDSLLRFYRQKMQDIRNLGLDATLDERSLCETCRASMEPAPKAGDFFIEVKNGETVTRTKIEERDLFKLIAFLEKKDTWRAHAAQEYPLKDELPRIREILGIQETTP